MRRNLVWFVFGSALFIVCILSIHRTKQSANNLITNPGDPINPVAHRTSSSAEPPTQQQPAWVVPYGKEFWRRPTPPDTSNTQKRGWTAGSFNLGDIIERVSSAIEADPGTGVHRHCAQTYTATFTDEGFRISPHLRDGEIMKEDSSDFHAEDAGRPKRTHRIPKFRADPDTEAVFRTVSIQVGDEKLFDPSTASAWNYLGNTAQRALNEKAGLIEHYETRNEGVEVSWILNSRPQAQGDLRIEADFRGVTYLTENETGHHYADENGISRLRVSGVVLADSAGKRIDLPLKADALSLRVSISAGTLDQLVFPIVIDPTVGPEVGMGVLMESHEQTDPSVGWNGTNYLVAWLDLRINGISATRVTTGGDILDIPGFSIATNIIAAEPLSMSTDIASIGGDFFVVWQDGRNPSSDPQTTAHNEDIYGARVRWDGVVLDSSGIGICTVQRNQVLPRVAANGTNYLVVWMDARNVAPGGYGDIFGGRVSTNGSVLDANGFAVIAREDCRCTYSPDVASNGSEFLVGWEDWITNSAPAVYVARVNNSGAVLDSGGVFLKANSGHPVLAYASSATNYLVAYQTNNSPGKFYGNRLQVVGGIQNLDAGGFVISTNSIGYDYALASNGTNYLAVFIASDTIGVNVDLYGQTIRASDAAILNSADFPICSWRTAQDLPAVASNGKDFLVAWLEPGSEEDAGAYTNDIFAARVRADGKVLDNFGVSTDGSTLGSQWDPDVAYIGSDYLVVWRDSRNSSTNGYDIYGTRVDSTGFVKDPAGIAICKTTSDQQTPGVSGQASGGGTALVVWLDKRSGSGQVYGARVINGIVSETNGFLIYTNGYEHSPPVVGSLGSDFLVAWQQSSVSTDQDIYAARVSSSGTVLDATPIAVNTQSAAQRFPQISGIGTNYFLVYLTLRPTNGVFTYDVVGSRLSTTGNLIDASPINICSHTNHQEYPKIATDGTVYFVVWTDQRNGLSNIDVYGARVSSAGILQETNGIAISTATGTQKSPAIASVDGAFLAVWSDSRNSSASGSDIYGARLGSDGSVTDSSGFLISDFSGNQSIPRIAAYSSGQYLVIHDSDHTSAASVRAHLVKP